MLTPASNCSSVVSLPSDSQIKQNLERNPVRRAMARAARGEQLTPISAANARAACQILDGKVVSHEMARALEEASTTVTPNRHVTPGGGGVGPPMPNGDGDFQFGFEFNDAVNDFEFHKKTAERLIPSIKSIDQMFSSIKSIGAAMDTPTMNKMPRRRRFVWPAHQALTRSPVLRLALRLFGGLRMEGLTKPFSACSMKLAMKIILNNILPKQKIKMTHSV